MLIYGKKVREQIREEIHQQAMQIKMKLAVVRVGDDRSSLAYVKGIQNFATDTGIALDLIELSADSEESQVFEKILALNNDRSVTGIMIQTPLPENLSFPRLLNAIDYHKDVEGIHNFNLGKLISKEDGVKPSTPKAVLRMLKAYNIPLEGQKVCIIGRSTILGLPLSIMMTAENATVTVCHTRTKNLADEIRSADIVVACAGKINLITPDMITEDTVIIDAGINFDESGKMCGDVHEEARDKARICSAVPGGVGVITVAELFDNLRILSEQAE